VGLDPVGPGSYDIESRALDFLSTRPRECVHVCMGVYVCVLCVCV